MPPRRDKQGRFVARKRRNPDGAMFRDAEGRLHPIRSWAGYDAGKTTAGPGKTAPPAKPARRPKVGTPAERRARAIALVEQRTAGRMLADEARREAEARRRRGSGRPVGVGPASEKQRQYIADLLARRGKPIRRVDDAGGALGMSRARWGRLTKQEASDLIGRLR